MRVLPYRAERALECMAALRWVARTEKDGWVLTRDAASIGVKDLFRAFVFDAEAAGVGDADLGLSLKEYAEKEKQ